MSTNKILIGGLIGGLIALLIGFLFYGVLLADFFESSMGEASSVMRAEDEIQWIPMVIGHLTWGLLVSLILGNWPNIRTLASGAQTGLILGLLVALTFGLINYATTNMMTVTSMFADVAVSTGMTAAMGAAIGRYFGMTKK